MDEFQGILPRHLNLLSQTCADSYLGYSEFQLTTQSEKRSCVIRLHTSSMEFYIEGSPADFVNYRYRYKRWAPGLPFSQWMSGHGTAGSSQRLGDVYSLTILDVCRGLATWIDTEVREYIDQIETSNRWAVLNSDYQVLPKYAIGPVDLLPITTLQRETISAKLNDLGSILKTELRPQIRDTTYVNRAIDYLKSALERLLRFDWHQVAISTLQSIAINATVDTETGKQVFTLVQQFLVAIGKILNVA